MLKETTYDTFYTDVFRYSSHSRPQAAYAANNKVDWNSGLTGFVERIDHIPVHQRIHLGPDAARPTFLGCSRLCLDQLNEI